MRNVPILAIFLAGVIHLAVAPVHYTHAPAHGIFFALAGAAEIFWALAFWRRPSTRLYYVGLAVAGGLVILWAVTRVLIQPFEHEPGPLDAGGLVCKGCELVGVVMLAILALQGRLSGVEKRSPLRLVGQPLAMALVVGVGSLGMGYGLEPYLPTLASQEEPMSEMPGYDHAALSSGATVTLGQLQISGAWARPAQMGGTSAVYLTIVNTGEQADALVDVQSPVAESAEVHEMRMDGDVMRMQPVARVEVAAGGRVELKPGGYHIMLMGLTRALAVGERIPIVLQFEHSGQVAVEATVTSP
ncbi:MAG: copper chaperone PCu(A)C [Chloroflexi bacterium]|nr:copper chaperone PCu(A)C [Chloroflexota bacterium]